MSTLRATNIKNPDSGSNNIVLSEGGGVVISGVTTSSSFVGNVTGNATGLSGTPNLNVGVVTATSFVGDGSGLTGVGGASGNRNLIINGDMSIAQRGTSSTTSGYATVDRWINSYGSGTVTQSQESLTSGDPYDEGFRNFFRVTNTSASASPTTESQTFLQYIEGYNIASSGWNYKSPSSYVTLSFWVRSSLAGTYYGKLGTLDGTTYAYPFSMTLSANTWTKVTKTIPGNSNLTLDNDNGGALGVYITSYYGTNNTDSGVSLETWAAFNATAQYPDFPQNWKGTASATFDITGVQLEVGSSATTFEHRSYGDELARCQRYYYKVGGVANPISNGETFGVGIAIDIDFGRPVIVFPVTMRGKVTAVETTGTASDYLVAYKNQEVVCGFAPSFSAGSATSARITFALSTSPMTQGHAMEGRANNSNAYLGFSAEL